MQDKYLRFPAPYRAGLSFCGRVGLCYLVAPCLTLLCFGMSQGKQLVGGTVPNKITPSSQPVIVHKAAAQRPTRTSITQSQQTIVLTFKPHFLSQTEGYAQKKRHQPTHPHLSLNHWEGRQSWRETSDLLTKGRPSQCLTLTLQHSKKVIIERSCTKGYWEMHRSNTSDQCGHGPPWGGSGTGRRGVTNPQLQSSYYRLHSFSHRRLL